MKRVVLIDSYRSEFLAEGGGHSRFSLIAALLQVFLRLLAMRATARKGWIGFGLEFPTWWASQKLDGPDEKSPPQGCLQGYSEMSIFRTPPQPRSSYSSIFSL
jgi:hypothetical protein